MLKGLNDSVLLSKKINHMGCVFFIQRWSELTYEKTIDSYQYSIMNPVVSLKECFTIVSHVLDGTYPTLDNLSDSKSELFRLLQEDWIIKKYNSKLYNNLLYTANMKIETKNESTKIANLKHLRSKITYQIDILGNNFNKWLEIEVLEAIALIDLKKINYLTNILISQSIDIGWSKKGLFRFANYFNNKEEDDLEVVKKFINLLFREKDQYAVYIKINKKDNIADLIGWADRFSFKLLLGKDVYNMFLPTLQRYLSLEQESYYLEVKVFAKDSIAAAISATEKCKKMMELLTFHNKSGPWSPDGTVFYTVRNNEYVDVLRSHHIFNTTLYIESSNSVFENTLKIFSTQDRTLEHLQVKLQSVYSYINISKLAKYREEEFLNMWIGIESFMNTGNYSNIISHIKNVLPSVLCKRYIYRLIRNLCEDLQRCAINLHFSSGNIDLDSNDKHELVKEMIKIFKNEMLYGELITLSKENSLLHYRIESLKCLISDEKKIYDKIIRYSETVLWHVQRLYRLRNDITHSGYLSEHDITPYIEHLHNFTAALIIEVIYVVVDESMSINTVGDILSYLKDTFEAYKDEHSISNSVCETGIIAM